MDGASTLADRSLERSVRNRVWHTAAGQDGAAQRSSAHLSWGAPRSCPTGTMRTPREAGSDEAASCDSSLIEQCTVLIVEESAAVREALAAALAHWRCSVLAVGDFERARLILAARAVDMLISGVTSESVRGIELLEYARRVRPATLRVLLTGSQDFRLLRSAINRGSVVFVLAKPWDRSSLAELVACMDSGKRNDPQEASIGDDVGRKRVVKGSPYVQDATGVRVRADDRARVGSVDR